jgi:probable rRNA maturation factor
MKTSRSRSGDSRSAQRTRRVTSRLSLSVQGRERFARAAEPLPADTTLRRWLRAALQGDAMVTLRFVDAREGRRLNRDFRGRDYATNVLTFNYARAPVEADIVLCVPVIAREARAQHTHWRAHLAHLVVHGALHAQGHEHETDAEATRMERLEVKVLAALGYPDPYLPRAPSGATRRKRSPRGPGH